jgi:2-dehydro-3-deoxyphosphogluconate aldolase / (4S)-4-hydroxy-2-oxoglutarate aldolase
MAPAPDQRSAVTARPAITPQLLASGVVAILRARSGERLRPVAEALAGAGISCLELTLTTPGALDALREIRPVLDDTIAVGIGTVITAEQAAAVLEAGADFVVSPGVCADATRRVVAAGVPCYPGAWTATEVLEAWSLGASAVKLFPAATGGPRHLRDLRGPLPDIPLVPTGGVAIDDIAAYMRAGAVAVGLGGPLIGDALDGGSPAGLAQRATAALAAVTEGRGPG